MNYPGGAGAPGQGMMPFGGNMPPGMVPNQAMHLGISQQRLTPAQQQQRMQHLQMMQQQQAAGGMMGPHGMMQPNPQMYNPAPGQQMPFGHGRFTSADWRQHGMAPAQAKDATPAERKRLLQQQQGYGMEPGKAKGKRGSAASAAAAAAAQQAAAQQAAAQQAAAQQAAMPMMMPPGAAMRGGPMMGYPPGAGPMGVPGPSGIGAQPGMQRVMVAAGGMPPTAMPSMPGQPGVLPPGVGVNPVPINPPQQSGASPQINNANLLATGSPHTSIQSSPGVHNMQPATPQGALAAPVINTTPGASGTLPVKQEPAEVDAAAEYTAAVKELKEHYFDSLRRIADRANLDKTVKPKGLDRVIEILENKRVVPIKLLLGLKPQVHRIVEQESLTFPMMDALRSLETTSAVVAAPIAEERADAQANALADPWRSVRHLSIRVPEHIKRKVEEQLEKEEKGFEEYEEKGSKRRFNADDGISDAKRFKEVKEECEMIPPAMINESMMRMPMMNIKPDFKINCVFENHKRWQLPPMACEELATCRWFVDNQVLPASTTSPYVVVCVESQIIVCSPLRLLVPSSYPTDPVAVQFDRSFPENFPISQDLEKVFEKYLSLRSSARSITDFVESFDSACNEFLNRRAADAQQDYMPKKLSKGLVA